MLEITKETIFKGTSKVGDAAAKMFEARINTVNPESMSFNHYIVQYDLYKANRAAIGAEQLAFEDAAYAFQDQLIAEQAAL
ncbi:MAG: hypothetical protein Q7J65_09220 [Candidatus Marinimicrobia bacterium]|nr:hypothetical protein [Candidatus Neomarinimicrobiota bacterium]